MCAMRTGLVHASAWHTENRKAVPCAQGCGSRQALVGNLLQHDQEEALPFIIVLNARQHLLDPTLDESDVKPRMQV